MKRLFLAAVLCAASTEDPVLVNIPAGTFTMGRTRLTSDDQTNMRPHVLLDDRPLHQVSISAFQLDKHEVTNAQYRVFVDKTRRAAPYHWIDGRFAANAADLPVYNVDWYDAHAYCAWAGGRLAH